MTRRPSDVKRGLLIVNGGLSDRIYAVTRWREEAPIADRPRVAITALAKVDVTDQVLDAARTSPRLLGVVPELRDFIPEWPE